jgi:hypothetical protein
MLKAFDAFLDKRLSERKFDLSTSFALQKTSIDALSEQEILDIRKEMGLRSSMAVTSNYLALACPILPFALLNAFFALNKLDNKYGPQLLSNESVQARQMEAMKAAAILADLEKKKKSHSIADERFNLLLVKTVNKTDKRKIKDKQVLFKSKNLEMLNNNMLNKQKKKLDIGKALKAKTFLQAQLERYNKRQDIIGATKTNVKISLLEKTLKRLGC